MGRKITSIITILGGVLGFIFFVDSNSFLKTSEEKYVIQKWQSTYINSTGQKAKDNKIHLSDNYWTSGKFGF